MKILHGIDLVDCNRIEKMLSNERFIERVFTPVEIEYSNSAGNDKGKVERFSGRFASKEAVLKLIGTGWRGKIAWTDIEVTNDNLGKPLVNLTGEVKKKSDEMSIVQIEISITHTANLVIASAVALIEVPGDDS